jgi:hypothetical protein
MEELPCAVCANGGDKPVLQAVEKKSAQTAHVLAMKEVQKKREGEFTFVELYSIYFNRIYEHEYSRNLYYMRNKHEHELYKSAVKTGNLCYYHGEFSEAFNEQVMKDLDKEYTHNEWPNKGRW